LIAIIDYGMGNLRSVEKAAASQGLDVLITARAEIVKSADGVILPGVGAFPDAMDSLKEKGLVQAVHETVEKGKPILGVCLGMQLLFEKSFEVEEREGLGILPGEIIRLPGTLKVPHMGWNSLDILHRCPILDGIPDESFMYFVHSYYAAGADEGTVCAVCDYGVKVPAAVSKNKVFGVQFHPEKSGDEGLIIYRNFGRLAL
jgi:glutamine amidotransferase